MSYHNKYACWFLVNGFECPHRECLFSHDPYDVCIKRQSLMVSVCQDGINCKTKCNKIHNYKDMCYQTYNDTRKRKRSLTDLDECNKRISKLEYALSQQKRENLAIKEIHKKTMSKEYMDENYLHVKNMNGLYSRLFNKFRLDFYNLRDNEEPEMIVEVVNKYINDMNNTIQFRNTSLTT